MAPSALGGPSLAAFEHLLGDERGSHRRWPAGVERQMGNDFAQFALFEPVVERTLQVADQLLLAAECYQGGARDQAASRSSSRAFRAKAVMRAATFRPRNPMTVTPFVDRLIANGRIPRQVRLVLGSRIADPQPTLTEYMRVGRWPLANSRRCRSRISSGQEW